MPKSTTCILISALVLYCCTLANASAPLYIQIEKKAEPTEARPGDIIVYTITCSNHVSMDYTHVKVVDTLSQELEFVDFVGKAGEYQKEHHKIIFDVGRLRAGGKPQEFKYRARAATNLDATRIHWVENATVVTSEQGDLPPVMKIVPIIPDLLKLALVCNEPSMQVGNPATFVADIENISVDTAIKDLTIVDIMPPSVRYIKGTSRVNGKRVADPKIETIYDTELREQRQKISWVRVISAVEPETKSKLAFRAVLVPPVSHKAAFEKSICRASGQVEIRSWPTAKYVPEIIRTSVPRITPAVEQPQRLAAKVQIPSLEIEHPIIIKLRPVEVALPIVTNPAQPPYVEIEFKPDRIPAGDPKIIVTSPDVLLNVVVEHPDGRKIQLEKNADGSWQAEVIVPFDTTEGPYSFAISVTDEAGREWYFSKTIMIDNSIPNVYGEFVPKTITTGDRTRLKVTLLIDAKDVYARFRDVEKTLHLKRERRFHWSVEYTIPKNMRLGWHNAEVVVIPKDDPRFEQRAIIAYKVK